ncbi:MAG: alpha/beta fold hydrolase [Polyangiales bacterium]
MLRRGRLGLLLSDDPRALVRAVAPDSPAARAGILPGDLLDAARTSLSRCRAGVSVTLRVTRGGDTRALSLTPDALPEESHPGLTTVYGSLSRDGRSLRTILVTPDAPRATVLYAQGADTGSIERTGGSDDDPLRGLVRDLAGAGLAVMRVERFGAGDSDGDDPGSARWDDDREDLAAALAATPGASVLLLGHSLGAMHAAAVAHRDPRVRGVVMYGAGIDPWRAYLDANLRRQLALARAPDAEALAREVLACWTALLDGAETLALQGDRARAWSGFDGARWFGRALAYWRAVDREDPSVALRALRVPVLAMWGASDWASDRDEHARIAALTGGDFAEVPRADHGFADFARAEDSFAARGRGRWQPAVGQAICEWVAQRS